jgi:hypothetical protein
MNVIQIALILLALGLYYAFRFSMRGAQTQAVVRLKRIRYVARFFRWICCAAFVFIISVGALAIFVPGIVGHKVNSSSMTISTKPSFMLSEFKPENQWLYPVFWVLLVAFVCRGIGFFYRLFSNLEKGMLFSADNVRCIRGIGLWLVLWPLLALGFEISKLSWATVAPGMIDVSDVPGGFLEGFFVIFIAWIMDEGRKIQEEQELTI